MAVSRFARMPTHAVRPHEWGTRDLGRPPWGQSAQAYRPYFHSHILEIVLPEPSTSYSKAPQALLIRASFWDAVWKNSIAAVADCAAGAEFAYARSGPGKGFAILGRAEALSLA